jgi:hypothetical protein
LSDLQQVCPFLCNKTDSHDKHKVLLKDVLNTKILNFMSWPDPKDHVSYYHHLVSVLVYHKLKTNILLFLTPRAQFELKLGWISPRISTFKIVSNDPIIYTTWLLLLLIEHSIEIWLFDCYCFIWSHNYLKYFI